MILELRICGAGLINVKLIYLVKLFWKLLFGRL